MMLHPLSVFSGIHDDLQVHMMEYTKDRCQLSYLTHKDGEVDYTPTVDKTSAAAEQLCYCRMMG
jgi:hypothetical protein